MDRQGRPAGINGLAGRTWESMDSGRGGCVQEHRQGTMWPGRGQRGLSLRG